MKLWLFVCAGLFLIGCGDAVVTGVAAETVAVEETAVESDTAPSEPPVSEPVFAEPDSEIDAQALAFMDYHDGIWDARWEWFDEEGNLLGELTGVEEYRRVDDGYTQLMISTVHEMKQTTHSLLVYNPKDREILFFSSGAKGDYWIMRQDPVTGVMVSDPHAMADGQEMTLRFTILEKSQDAMTIQMERSMDGGENWVVGFHQYNRRRAS